MFNNPLVLPIILGVIALAIYYLIVTSQNDTSHKKTKNEEAARSWQVQCPNCGRWKKMRPIRREKLLNAEEARQRRVLHGPQPRFLHDYKCTFCGHTWQEQYAA